MGQIVGNRFELLEPIGEGGTGFVWVALDHERAALAAVKVLRQIDAGGIVRFAREQAMRVGSDHVVAPYAWAAEDDTVAIAMPLRTGGSIATLVGDYGALPHRWVISIAWQAARALEAVHTAGIVHRDVTPANLLLEVTGSDEPSVALGDFGSAIAMDSPRFTGAGRYVGTPGFVAPEVEAGEPATAAADWFALGRVIDMLAGDCELADPRLREVTEQLQAERPEDRPKNALERLTVLRDAAGAWQVGEDDVEVLQHVDAAAALRSASERPIAVGRRTDREPTKRLDSPTPTATGSPTPKTASPLSTTALIWALAVVGVGLIALALTIAFS